MHDERLSARKTFKDVKLKHKLTSHCAIFINKIVFPVQVEGVPLEIKRGVRWWTESRDTELVPFGVRNNVP
jgi:hypothetical protein